MKKLPKDAEASNILVGELNGLQSPLSVFIRLNKALHLGDLTEVPVPTRFLFVLLAPKVRWKKQVIDGVRKLNETYSGYQNKWNVKMHKSENQLLLFGYQ